jgi:hypothetical protein
VCEKWSLNQREKQTYTIKNTFENTKEEEEEIKYSERRIAK